MVTELHLEGAELFTFALVHQFSQCNAGLYKGNTSYLSAWTGWSENTSRKYLTALVEKGLIEQVRGRLNNSPFCYYKLASDFYEKHPSIFEASPLKKRKKHPAKNALSTPQDLRGDNTVEKVNRENTIVGDFVPPTVAQVREYADAHGFRSLDAEHFVEFYDSLGWKQKNGKHITSWKNAVITWKKRDLDKGIDIASPIKAAAPLHKSDRAYNDAETFLNSYNK